ncbi:MAG: hypothetical protein QM536_02625 [Chitinophagaceae bacterium]|nr:hypothetical protein [Chitinophagaceae bacterium]
MNKLSGFFKKAFLKYTNTNKYILYKQNVKQLRKQKEDQKTEQLLTLFNARINDSFQKKTIPPYHFKHSGNSGDITYSLPIIKSISQGVPACVHLHLYQPGIYESEHPLGNVMLTKEIFDMLTPLLKSQKYIDELVVYDGKKIDFDLDIMRNSPILLDRGCITGWYSHVFNIFPDLTEPWLEITPNKAYKKYIVITRSQRYNNPSINYSFLRDYPNVLFMGVLKEYEIMKKSIPNIEYKSVKDFLEMAQIIAGSKFFIGNQTFAFSLAEAMKVPRVLEIYYKCPNVILHGKNGYSFYFQYHFENIVKQLDESR